MTGQETGLEVVIETGLQPISTGLMVRDRFDRVPVIISREGERAARRFVEFFAANIRNRNTREAYGRAIGKFLDWSDRGGIGLAQIEPVVVAAYIEKMTREREAQTVKQHLAAIRMLFDWLVIGQILPSNPATSVRGPRYSYKRGKTPVLSAADARKLLDSIDTSHVVGLRDRALIALMVFSFARVGAVTRMLVSDYYPNGKTWWIRLHEKGGKFHEVPVHHNAEAYIDAYIEMAGIAEDKKGPLFRSAKGRTKTLTEYPVHPTNVLMMIKRRAKEAGLPDNICCHTFRATGITTYLENGGSVEHAQQIAAHESPRTTKLYDRRNDQISLDEIERILI
jgi:site-specific recombinase XerD